MPPRAADKTTANIKASTPIMKPSAANSNFMAIKNAKPSKSQENIIPGNLIDKPAHHTNTSPIYDPERMQYIIANIPYPIKILYKTPRAG